MKPNILELMLAMNTALDEAGTAYKLYIEKVRLARVASQELFVAIDDIVNQPHIQIQDFEIDG